MGRAVFDIEVVMDAGEFVARAYTSGRRTLTLVRESAPTEHEAVARVLARLRDSADHRIRPSVYHADAHGNLLP